MALHPHARIEQLLALFCIAQIVAKLSKNYPETGSIGWT